MAAEPLDRRRSRFAQAIRPLTMMPLAVALTLTAVVLVTAARGLVYAGPTSAAEGN